LYWKRLPLSGSFLDWNMLFYIAAVVPHNVPRLARRRASLDHCVRWAVLAINLAGGEVDGRRGLRLRAKVDRRPKRF